MISTHVSHIWIRVGAIGRTCVFLCVSMCRCQSVLQACTRPIITVHMRVSWCLM
jgi:hypothetical protein